MLRTAQQSIPVLCSGPFDPKNASSRANLDSHLILGFSGPRQYALPSPPNRISIGSAVRRTPVCPADRQATLLVTTVSIGRVYVVHAMRPENVTLWTVTTLRATLAVSFR